MGLRIPIAILALSAIVACSGVESRRSQADALAAAAGLAKETVPTERFVITVYARLGGLGQPLTVYFEGDGFAWISRTRPSPDPTPTDPMALRLAAQDPAPNVVYVARPCQYTPRDADPACRVAYWTKRRFAPEVVASMNRVVEVMRRRAESPSVRLVGYSGGGAIAVLVAALRSDVDDIRTIAANLDTDAFVAYHAVSRMDGSLNPVSVAARLASVPQMHLVGGADEIVPMRLAEGYRRASGTSGCVRFVEISGATHDRHWPRAWQRWRDAPMPQC